jgi:hypothetical protein
MSRIPFDESTLTPRESHALSLARRVIALGRPFSTGGCDEGSAESGPYSYRWWGYRLGQAHIITSRGFFGPYWLERSHDRSDWPLMVSVPPAPDVVAALNSAEPLG